jgi:hypothetical protein
MSKIGTFASAVGNSKFGKGVAALTGIGAPSLPFVGIDSAMNIANGDSLGTGVMKGFATGALMASMPPVAVGMMALDAAGLGVKGYSWYKERDRQLRSMVSQSNVVGGGYQDTERALTMRQASIQAIQGSKLNARSALGGEARILSPYDNRRY